MEIAGLVISIIALLLALFTYFKHDLKIKKHQIEKIEKEKTGEKKAVIEANVIKGNKGKRQLKIYNKGKSIAKNVTVTILNIDGFRVIDNPCPIDIKPQNGIEISLILFMDSPDKIDIESLVSLNKC